MFTRVCRQVLVRSCFGRVFQSEQLQEFALVNVYQ